MTHRFEAMPKTLPAGWLIGPRSHKNDAWKESVTWIALPSIRYPGGHVTISWSKSPTTIPERLGKDQPAKTTIFADPLSDEYYLDFREKNVQGNIWHAISHAVYAAMAEHTLEQTHQTRPPSLVLLLPQKTKPFILEAYRQLGFHPIAEHHACNSFAGEISVVGHRPERILAHQWLPPRMIREAKPQLEPKFDKLLILRRSTRRLTNEEAISQFLFERGFTPVFMEDFPISQQFAMIQNASSIVAIHGAGLAALALRTPARLPSDQLKLVELFHPGYVVTPYREMAHNLNAHWIGVCGRPENEGVHAFFRRNNARRFAESSFSVDIASLEIALEFPECHCPPQNLIAFD